MKRFVFAVSFLFAASLLCGQVKISSTRIYTEPAGAAFFVDDMYYNAPVTFFWPEKSKHTLRVSPLTPRGEDTRFVCDAPWASSNGTYVGTSPLTMILAEPSVAYYKTACRVEYRVQLSFFNCPSADVQTCGGGVGQIYVEGAHYDRSSEFWTPAGALLRLQAMPIKGFAFVYWGLGVTKDQSYMTSVTVNGPMMVYARFEPAKQITLLTSPPNLQVLVDRQPLQTPVTVDWADGSKHVLSGVSPQTDRATGQVVFDSWDVGGGENMVYTASNVNTIDTVTARYVLAARASFMTEPRGLKLKIDGRENWPAYNFLWGVGSTHPVVAAAEQTDSRGRRYRFKGWSNGAEATQQFVVDDGMVALGSTLIASYEMLGRVTLQTSPSGLPVQVEGSECATPCLLDRPAGAQLAVVAPAATPLTDNSRFDFQSWSDGGPRERIWTFTPEGKTITATYQVAYRLQAASDPAGGAQMRVDPASADGYYPVDTRVSATADAKAGFRFRRWDGDLSGTYKTGYLTVSGPRAIRAMLDRIPYIAPAGVRNAAGDTPEPLVATGSIIAIIGASLAGEYVAADSNPLPQAIGQVTVRMADRLLPLLFVSPEQINAQLPSDLPEGAYALTVRWEGHPEVTGAFQVARNAPGLFVRSTDERPFAMAAHEDGSPITPDSPARRGETVTLYGTGFGPYVRPAPDGFALPTEFDLPLADTVQILTGDLTLQPAWSGAATGFTGLVATRLKIGDELPAAATAELRVKINGRESNKVLLPVE